MPQPEGVGAGAMVNDISMGRSWRILLMLVAAICHGCVGASPPRRSQSAFLVGHAVQEWRPASASGRCAVPCTSRCRTAEACATRHAFRRGMEMRLNPRSSDVNVAERAVSTLPYFLPILDGVVYGKFFFQEFPQLFDPVLSLMAPLLVVYKSSPFIQFGAYLFLVYLARNTSLPRFVRFNVQQAVLLDIALILPSIILGLLRSAPLVIQEPLNNTMFFVLASSVGYAIACLLIGKKPTGIPLISEAAEMTLGPF